MSWSNPFGARIALDEHQRLLAQQLIDIGYKKLAMRHHPDLGGKFDDMIRLNAVKDRLKAAIEPPAPPKPIKRRRK